MLYFVTSNAGKFQEVKMALPDIKQLKLELDEVQSLDPHAVIEHKLAQATAQHDGEFIVEDTSLILNCLNGLPGTMIKWFEQTVTVPGLADLAMRYDDHSAVARVTIGYRGNTGAIEYFVGEQTGQIVKPRGTISTFGWNEIFQPDGHTQTFAEMTVAEKNAISMRGIAVAKLKRYLESLSQ